MSSNQQNINQENFQSQNQVYRQEYPMSYANQEAEIDIRELFLVLWDGKWWIIAITALFAIASVFYALSLPNEYKATAIVAPASSQGGGGSLNNLAGQLGGLVSLAGVNLGSAETTDAIVAMELMQTWQFIDAFIKRHELELPLYGVKGWDAARKEFVIDEEVYDADKKVWTLESLQKPTSWQLFESFKKRMSVSQDKETGLIYVSFVHYSPEFCVILV